MEGSRRGEAEGPRRWRRVEEEEEEEEDLVRGGRVPEEVVLLGLVGYEEVPRYLEGLERVGELMVGGMD